MITYGQENAFAKEDAKITAIEQAVSDEELEDYIKQNSVLITVVSMDRNPTSGEKDIRTSFKRYKEIFKEMGDTITDFTSTLLKLFQKLHKLNIIYNNKSINSIDSQMQILLSDQNSLLVDATTKTLNSRKAKNFLSLVVIRNKFPFFTKMLVYKYKKGLSFNETVSFGSIDKSSINFSFQNKNENQSQHSLVHNQSVLSKADAYSNSDSFKNIQISKQANSTLHGDSLLHETRHQSFAQKPIRPFNAPVNLSNLLQQSFNSPESPREASGMSGFSQSVREQIKQDMVNVFYGEAATWKIFNYQSSPQPFLPEYKLPENDLAALGSNKIIDILVRIVQKTKGKSLTANNRNEQPGVYFITLLLGPHNGEFLCSATIECCNKAVAKEVAALFFIEDKLPAFYWQLVQLHGLDKKYNHNDSQLTVIPNSNSNPKIMSAEDFWSSFCQKEQLEFGYLDFDDISWIKFHDKSLISRASLSICNPQNFKALSELFKKNGMTFELSMLYSGQFALTYRIAHHASGQHAEIALKIQTERLDRAIIAAETKIIEFLFPEFFTEFVDFDGNEGSESQLIEKYCRTLSCELIDAKQLRELHNLNTPANLEFLERLVKETQAENNELDFKHLLLEMFEGLKLIVYFANSSLPIQSNESKKRWKIDLSVNKTPLASFEIYAPNKELAYSLASLYVLLKVFPEFRNMIG
jgi:hypothetical protein